MIEVRELTAGYGSMVVLHEVELKILPKEIVSLIGPNGAGKSTILKAIAGLIDPYGGIIIFNGRDIGGVTVAGKNRLGLIFIPQGHDIFPHLTVRENLEVGLFHLRAHREFQRACGEIYEKFDFIKDKRNRPAGTLSSGERRLLALSRILIINPRLVLIDEPSRGLAPGEADSAFEQIKELNKRGISFLIAEQNARRALSISHRFYVFELGRNRTSGKSSEFYDNPDLEKHFRGG